MQCRSSVRKYAPVLSGAPILRVRRILVGSGNPDHRSADENRVSASQRRTYKKRFTENKACGRVENILAELGCFDAGRVFRARRTTIPRGLLAELQALLGPYPTSWGT